MSASIMPERRIGEALANLPGPERTAVILRHMEDRSYAEIAKLMDAPEGSVKTWIRRQNLRENSQVAGVGRSAASEGKASPIRG